MWRGDIDTSARATLPCPCGVGMCVNCVYLRFGRPSARPPRRPRRLRLAALTGLGPKSGQATEVPTRRSVPLADGGRGMAMMHGDGPRDGSVATWPRRTASGLTSRRGVPQEQRWRVAAALVSRRSSPRHARRRGRHRHVEAHRCRRSIAAHRQKRRRRDGMAWHALAWQTPDQVHSVRSRYCLICAMQGGICVAPEPRQAYEARCPWQHTALYTSYSPVARSFKKRQEHPKASAARSWP
jgi:hypothetical protein